MTFHGADETVSSSQSQSSSSSSSPSNTNDTNSTITRKTPSTYQWAQSTELGDFVQEAAKDRKFVIAIQQPQAQQQAATTKNSGNTSTSKTAKGEEDVAESSSNDKTQGPVLIKIRVPSFEERTLFLRRRLVEVTKEMQSLLDIKSECDVSRHPAGQLGLQA